MKVLILGATGFLGLPAAEAFVRAGHIVYGTTRSARSAIDILAAREIVPVVVDPFDENGKKEWGKIAAEVDVVIDALSATGSKAALDTFNNYLEYVDRPRGSPKPTYIYTSGLWINARGYGGLDKWTDERQPVSKFNKAVQWRPEIEVPVLESEKVNGIVIRPAMVYGRSGSAVANYIFDEALKGQKAEDGIWETIYSEESRYTTIHTDDAADLYLRVAERGTILAGQVFLAANQATERLTDVLDAVVRVSGTKGYKSKPPQGDFDKAYLSSTLLKPSLGYALTGWVPRKLSLVDGMDIYWSAYLASKGKLQI
ncbi:uncharacterized protein I303_102109 [Kwoniella dejecticola CBS 10117]|uniref:NAD-dependent epimerase/dehydratase domain-containing protein n=1 Tax=Kwoniella dejecticola CBS 10117 TaxID=1296121 RepID=A0AAJ8KKY4_9TREE